MNYFTKEKIIQEMTAILMLSQVWMNNMQRLIKYVKVIRGYINRSLYPASLYLTSNEYKKPLSNKFGFDRGTPIDRYWIEDFLEKNKSFIKGKCLEITDNFYTQKINMI